ncbi:MAG: RloB domain-containing protein [Thermotogota bacterium]
MAMYRKSYVCICEGQQEKQYLEHLARLIKKFPEKVVTFNCYIDQAYRLKKIYEETDCGVLFDYDLDQTQFENSIKLCDQLHMERKRQNIYHAYSSLNFDLWLILHRKDYFRTVTRNDAYLNDVKKVYGLKKEDYIKKGEIIRKILEQISLEDVKEAIKRVEKIKYNKLETDAVKIGNTITYTNPDFSLHEFLKLVLLDSGDL